MRLPVYNSVKSNFSILLHSQPNKQYYFTLPNSSYSDYTIFIYTKEEIALFRAEPIPMSVENILKFIEERNSGFGILDEISGIKLTSEEFIEKYKSS